MRYIDDLSMIFSPPIGCTDNQGTKGPAARRAFLFGTVALCLLTSKAAAAAVIQPTDLSPDKMIWGSRPLCQRTILLILEAPAAIVCPQGLPPGAPCTRLQAKRRGVQRRRLAAQGRINAISSPAVRSARQGFVPFPRPDGSVTMRVRRFVRLISRANVPCGHSPERSSS